MRFNGIMADSPLIVPDLELVPFTVVANFATVAENLFNWPQSERPMSGTVIFTPVLTDVIRTQVNSGASYGGFVIQQVQALISEGVLTRYGRPGVKLVANSTVLDLPELFYRVTYSGLKAADGTTIRLEPFRFLALTADSTLDLLTVAPDPVLVQ